MSNINKFMVLVEQMNVMHSILLDFGLDHFASIDKWISLGYWPVQIAFQ